MKAIIYPGDGQALTLATVADPTPGPGDLVIAVHRCGICGTDLHMTQGKPFQFPAGCIPGHEYAGEVVAIGAGVAGWAIGDRLTALPSNGCGRCIACDHGNLVLCRDAPGVMGGFAEYLKISAAVALKLPATLSLEDGALIEPLAVGRYGMRQVAIDANSRVLVLGGGSVALAAIWWARLFGAGRIVALSRAQRRADLALAMGADQFVGAGEGEGESIRAALGGPPTIVVECVGTAGMLARAIGHAGTLGHVISLGFCTDPDTLIPAVAATKGVTLHFPVGYALADFEAVARVYDAAHANPALMITSRCTLASVPDTFARLRGSHAETKVHVMPTAIGL